jgi:hypothetical protein
LKVDALLLDKATDDAVENFRKRGIEKISAGYRFK